MAGASRPVLPYGLGDVHEASGGQLTLWVHRFL